MLCQLEFFAIQISLCPSLHPWS
uniref:Uncharacterized protein n=1 Tax=Arundo donax TaxID=35708 RepID=A0A0A8Z1F2_ARUDO